MINNAVKIPNFSHHSEKKKKKKTNKAVDPPITLFKQAMKMTKICFPAQGRAADPSHAGRIGEPHHMLQMPCWIGTVPHITSSC